MKKRKKRREFSKVILTWVTAGVVFVVIFSCAMSWKTNDMSVFQYLIPAVFTELATATGFYYNKAKAENIVKIQNNVPKDKNDGE
ncbi:MAG: hypothetical protein Q8865_08870 [Bacillota bacterium]|nr:hypothetical protein [Bacillota bacterium]